MIFFLLFQNDWLRWHFPPKTSFCRWIWPTTWFSIFRRGPLQTWLEWSVWYWLATKFHASMTMFYQVKLFGIQPFSWHGSYLLSGCLCAPHSLGMLRIGLQQSWSHLYFLSDLENLVELDLSLNFLSSVPIGALGQLRNLKFLNLGSNRIQVCIIQSFDTMCYLS